MNKLAQPRRRKFLMTTGAATALVSSAGAGLVATSMDACQPAMSATEHACLRELAITDFSPLLGQPFRVYAPGHAAMLKLVEANALAANGAQRPKQARTTPFSLVFQSRVGSPLEAGIHEFEHEALGKLKLSLNPVGATSPEQGAVYEVVFG